ncbi:hypothetical protein ILYODFUR_007562 [Ilyodon furcidens]|uniref:Uncharacterized protein n=1 Tax=Ilyodon furcidens TaxID=33524 RepID=A0ABV0SK63_9TELE
MKRMLRVVCSTFYEESLFAKSSPQVLEDCPEQSHPSFISLLVKQGSGSGTPADNGRTDHTLHSRPVADMQHLAANSEGPQFPEEVQSALSLLRQLHCCISSPVCGPGVGEGTT